MAILNGFNKESDDFLLGISPVLDSGAGWDARIDGGFGIHANALRMTSRLLSLRKDVDLDFTSGNGFTLLLTPAGFMTVVTGLMIFNLDDTAANSQPGTAAATLQINEGSNSLGSVVLAQDSIPAPGFMIAQISNSAVRGLKAIPGGVLIAVKRTSGTAAFDQATDSIDAGIMGYTYPA